MIASSYRSIWLGESHGFSRLPIYVERQNQCTCELLSKLNWKLLLQSIRLRTIHWWLEDDSSLEQQLEHNGTCCCLNPWNDDRGNMTFEMAISVFHHNDYNLLTNQRNEFHFAFFFSSSKQLSTSKLKCFNHQLNIFFIPEKFLIWEHSYQNLKRISWKLGMNTSLLHHAVSYSS